tara:strand:- start:72 stop:590 length:519 start_codon:yes stop_codon:yes gene_type:complete
MKKLNKKNLTPSNSEASDYGNPSLIHHHAVRLEQIRPSGGRLRLRILDGSELDRLLHEDRISIEQHFSGEKFEGDVQSMKGGSSCLANLTRVQTGGNQASNRLMGTLGKVVDAMRIMEKNTERGTADLVMGVALNIVQINDDLLPYLTKGLDALGQHYSVARWMSPSFSLRR